MKKAIMGKKLGMTQVFTDDGTVIPVTVVEAGPCTVVQIKTKENEGYQSLQLAYSDIREKLVNKPVKGHFDKANIPYKRYIREFTLEDISGYEVGSEIKADIFAEGDNVDVTGVSKGKGTAGPVKRWNISKGRMSHGSHHHRGPGAMAAAASPGKVFKGKKLAGRMGRERVTVQNLQVVRVDTERNVLLVKGSVPGPRGTLLLIKDTVKER